jgi:hypothetical protein
MTQPRKDNCDICGKAFDTAKFGVVSTCCGSLHCPDCAAEAEKRGDYRSGVTPWCWPWRRCRNCSACCPNCGDPADFEPKTETHVETHGLDCGPYERWTETRLICSKCGAPTYDEELRRTNVEFFQEAF